MNFEDFARDLHGKWSNDPAYSLCRAYAGTVKYAWINNQYLHLMVEIDCDGTEKTVGISTRDDPDDCDIHIQHLRALVAIIRWSRLDTSRLDVDRQNAAKSLRNFIMAHVIGCHVVLPMYMVTVV